MVVIHKISMLSSVIIVLEVGNKIEKRFVSYNNGFFDSSTL